MQPVKFAQRVANELRTSDLDNMGSLNEKKIVFFEDIDMKKPFYAEPNTDYMSRIAYENPTVIGEIKWDKRV